MRLELDLTAAIEDYREDFCKYIINVLSEMITQMGDLPQYKALEEYINGNGLIDWQTNGVGYISVFDIYRLATAHLEIKQIDENTYLIQVDENENIPNSYTILNSIVSLLEYGTLSIQKCGMLSKCMHTIAENLTTYYQTFLLEGSE